MSLKPLLSALALVALVSVPALVSAPVFGQEQTPERIGQQALRDRGYKIGPVDGIWGPRSVTAMKDLQRKLGLKQTGKPDAETIRVLAPPAPDPKEVARALDAAASLGPQAAIDASPVRGTAEAKTVPPIVVDMPWLDTLAKPPTVPPPPEPAIVTALPFLKPFATAPYLIGLGTGTGAAAIGGYLLYLSRKRRRQQEAAEAARIEAVEPVLPDTPTAEPEPAAEVIEPPIETGPWKSEHEAVTVGRHRLTRGLVYVAETLEPQNGWGQRDNCLIVPSLPVGPQADLSGKSLDYWPSYERLSPAARKAYLDWLTSDRSNPDTPIGFVFLYFYGLERRLMLDQDVLEREAILAEVERLIGIYGSKGSFQRYGAELLSAARALEGGQALGEKRPLGLGDVPLSDKLDIGRRAVARQPISPALLLSLAVNHPETRLRPSVRRLPDLVAQHFRARVGRDHPDGLVVDLPRRPPMLELTYRAASGTFEVPVIGTTHAVPDLAQLPEPLGYARSVLDAVSEELEDYSEEVLKGNGASATIASLSKLPPELRQQQAAIVAADAIAKLNAVADSGQLFRVADLLALLGLKKTRTIKSGLRDLSQCLADWGMGLVPDPYFAPAKLADSDRVQIFRLGTAKGAGAKPSERYRLVYVMLALSVAGAVERVGEAERRLLSRLIRKTPGLSEHERTRLSADFDWLEANPLVASDLRHVLKEPVAEVRAALLGDLALAAEPVADDGAAGLLERLATTLGLDPAGVAAARQAGGATRPAHVARLLSTIFAGEDSFVDSDQSTPAAASASELDQRHRVLLDELMTRREWSEEDFDRLVQRAGLVSRSVRSKLNDWSVERFDDVILDGDDPISVNSRIVSTLVH